MAEMPPAKVYTAAVAEVKVLKRRDRDGCRTILRKPPASAMPAIVQMCRILTTRPEGAASAGVRLRTYRGPADIPVWLELREQAFAGLQPAPRPWTASDFQVEFLARQGWRPDWMWFAEDLDRETAIGAASWILRGRGVSAVPAIHWLAVAPAGRRRGVGRALLSALEQSCWDEGYRQVRLETHPKWTAAIRFYEAMGYIRVGASPGVSTGVVGPQRPQL